MTAFCRFDEIHDVLMDKIIARSGSRNAFGDISLNADFNRQKFTLEGHERSQRLSCMEFLVLWLLIRAQGAIITSDDFYYFLYEESDKDLPLKNVVEVMVFRIRKKIITLSQQVTVVTVKGCGYRMGVPE